MAKKLQIKTPQTTDGVNLKYDSEKKIVYKTSLVELGARKHFESINSKLPKHLKHELKEVDVDDEIAGSSTELLQKRLAELEGQKANLSLQDRIAELEAELAGRKQGDGSGVSASPRGTVEEVAERLKGVTTVAEVEEIVKGDDRKGVAKAAEARIAEINGSK